MIDFTGKTGKTKSKRTSASSESSRISSKDVKIILNNLLTKQNRDSTTMTYLRIWRQFNSFLIKLDDRPNKWEDRVVLFLAYKIENGLQSASVKSYNSAIKRVLIDDGYHWDDNKVLLTSLTRACKLVNDRVRTRLPIHYGLLELILFEVERIFILESQNQVFLDALYKALFALSYYRLFRVGELTFSQHVVKACDVHIAMNKQKMMLVLYTSKTHGHESRPQKIKITSKATESRGNYRSRYFCPFQLARNYMSLRGSFVSPWEPFFIYRDGTPVTPSNARTVLKNILTRLGLDEEYYGMHSFRIGRTSDLVKFHYSIEEVKILGRWKSSIVYK